MKFNTLIIDKLNDFNSVLKPNAKKSSLIQFSDIVNVCNAESTDGLGIQLNVAADSSDKSQIASEKIVQVSPQELKDISSLLSIFENAGNAQSVEVQGQASNEESGKKELVLSKDQLESFFNVVLSPFVNYLAQSAQDGKIDQVEFPLTISFEDGTNKLSISVANQQNDKTTQGNAPDITDIPKIIGSNADASFSINGSTNSNDYSASKLVDFATLMSNTKSLPNDGLLDLTGGVGNNQLFNVEITQQTLNADGGSKTLPSAASFGTLSQLVSSEPTSVYQDKNPILPEGNYMTQKNAIEKLFSAVNITKTIPDQTANVFANAKANIPVEQILFGKNYISENSGNGALPKNIFEGLSEEEKSTFLKTLPTGDLLSMKFSSEPAKTIDSAPKAATINSVPLNNLVETVPLQVDQQISKQPQIFSLPIEQSKVNEKLTDSSHMQLHDLANEIASMKELSDKLVEKANVKEDLQTKETATLEKDPKANVTVKDDQQSTKNTTEAKTNSAEVTKSEKISAYDTQSNQQEDKDSGKRNTSELFKNTVLQNSASSGTGKTQFAAELKPLPTPVKTITQNDIIPEFSKIIQQGQKQTLTFQLSPENLGKVKLTVDMVANSLNAHIEVENDQVKQFIQSNIEQLKQNFQSNGIQLNSVNISLADYGDQRNTKAFVPKKRYSQRYSSEGLIDKATAPTTKKSMGYNTYEFLA